MSTFTILPVSATVNQSVLLTFTGTATAWTSATVFTASAGVLSSIEVDAANQTATALFAAPSNAQVVTFSDGAGSAGTTPVTVSAGTFAVSPASATINQSQAITLTGSGTQWTTATTFTPSAGTLSALSINVGAQTATATFVAPATAQTVTFADSNGAPGSDGIAVSAGSFSVSSASVKVESSTSLTLAGTGTSWTSATKFVPSLGAVTSVSVASATSATITFAAPATVQSVTFTDSNGAASTGTLAVTAGPFSVSPATSKPNQSQAVTFTSTGTIWSAATVFTASAGTLSNVTVTSATAATATFVAPNAPGTSATFSDNNGGVGSNGISVPATGAAGSFIVSPTTADPGSNTQITFTGTGTTWDDSSLFAASAGELAYGTQTFDATAQTFTILYAAPATAALVTFTVASNGGTGANGASYNGLMVGTPTATAASAPMITSAATASGTVGARFTYQTVASNAPTSFAATGLPTGFSINVGTGLVTGQSTQAGTYTVSLVASNAYGNSATFALTLTIVETFVPVVTKSPVAVLTAFTGQSGAAPTGFLNGSMAGAPVGVPPVYLGTANTSLGVPQVGAPLSITDSGLDVVEEAWVCRTTAAATLKPEPYDAHPYLANMYCDTSTSTTEEGKMSLIRATYYGLVKGTPRPAKSSFTNDTSPQTLTFTNGATAVGGGSGGDATGSTAANTITISGIPVPSPVYTLRGSTNTQPDATQLGAFVLAPPGVPAIAPTFVYPAYARAGIQAPWVLVATLVFAPFAGGWVCDRLEWVRRGFCYEVTQQWRMEYQISDYIYPTAADNAATVGEFSVVPAQVTAGTTNNVVFVGTGTKWTVATIFSVSSAGTVTGTLSEVVINVAAQTATASFAAPPTAQTVTVIDNNGASSSNSINVVE